MLSSDDLGRLRSVISQSFDLLERGHAPDFRVAYLRSWLLLVLSEKGSMEKEQLLSEVSMNMSSFEPYVESVLSEMCQGA